MSRSVTFLLILLGYLSWLMSLPVIAQDPKEKDGDDAATRPATLAKNPKPLSDHAKNGIGFLVKQQQADGSWSGGPAAAMFENATGKSGQVDVGNTSIAALALLRAGYSPKQGPYAENIRKAIGVVLKSVESSDAKSLDLDTAKGTQIQRKIGGSADTYLAAMLLATAKGAMPDVAGETRLARALQKIVDKMEANQKDNGTWQGEGWAPVLSQALASKAINMAKQAGMAVDGDKLDKTAKHGRESFKQFAEGKRGGGAVGFGPVKGAVGFGGNAGVDLYGAAAAISALQDAVNTNRFLSKASQSVLRTTTAAVKDLDDAKRQLARLDEHEKALRDALSFMGKKSLDNDFNRGFGSDGGEEFISFTLIGEAMLSNHMKEFPDWNRAMTNRLVNSQNGNGSWSGKHCITGEVFCTATALMTMMSDRAHRPVGSELVHGGSRPTLGKKGDTERPDLVEPKKVVKKGDTERTDLAEPKKEAPAASTDINFTVVLRDLVNDEGDRSAMLTKLRDGKGGEFTDTLARAARKLTGEGQKEARTALAERLTRMKAATLRTMLRDDDAEIRRAAAYACAMKEDRAHVPDLIPLLSDAEPMVTLAGRTALKNLTGQDFGPDADARPGDKTKAILAWKDWWSKNAK